jgi:hypothetical protein
VGETIARELGWSAERVELELERFAEEARVEGIDGGADDAPDERVLAQGSAAGTHSSPAERAP